MEGGAQSFFGGTIVLQVLHYGQCRRAGARKGSLRLVLMSATIELEPFVRYFESAAHVVRCGRIARAPGPASGYAEYAEYAPLYLCMGHGLRASPTGGGW